MVYAAVRGIIFIVLLLIIGSQTAADLVRRGLQADPELDPAIHVRLRRMLAPLLIAFVVACLAKLALQILSMRDPGDPITSDLVEAVVGSRPWGASWVLQISATFLFLGWLAIGGARKGLANFIAAAFSWLLAWNQSGMGHAAGGKWPGSLGRWLDTVHILGLGLWLGTLTALAIVAFPMLRGEERLPSLARVVRAFSLVARIGVATVIVSGVIVAIRYVGPIATIAQSSWGRLLLIKIACMLGVMALGWYNWRVVTPALDGRHPTCRQRLRTAVRLELALGFVMLVLTAFLVASALPGEG